MSIILLLFISQQPAYADGLETVTTCAILASGENYIRFDLHPKRGEGLWYESMNFTMLGRSYHMPLTLNDDSLSFTGVVRGIESCGVVTEIQYNRY
jgi:hypothetical protein